MSLISIYWKEFQLQNPKYKNTNEPQSFYFCDNKKDADDCAELVIKKLNKLLQHQFGGLKKTKKRYQKLEI